ncbi:MAG: 6-bladed beta-propeller [Odoribacter splanchnicus]
MSFVLIVFFFFCFSCNNYIPPSIPPTIVINKEDGKQTYKLSDIVLEYQLIPLETSDSCLIGSVGKIIFDTTSFYLKGETSKLIYHFDLTFYHIPPPAINAFTVAGDPVSVLYTSF